MIKSWITIVSDALTPPESGGHRHQPVGSYTPTRKDFHYGMDVHKTYTSR